MTESSDSDTYKDTVLAVVRRFGTVTANQVSRLTKRKQETAKRYLDLLEKEGQVYTKNQGKRTYFILMPSGNFNRVKPDRSEVEIKTEVYGRPSFQFPLIRGKTALEIIPQKGFVCHPSTQGISCGREFVRCHYNGEYQVGIKEVGAMPSTDFIPDTNLRVRWNKTGLTTNTACIGYIKNLNGDQEEFTVRTVSNKKGQFNKLSVWVHPRYIFHTGHVEVSRMEFNQQVLDVCGILVKYGWTFKDKITRKGEPHYGINDPILGSLVGEYNQSPNDPLHFDHSHGIHEGEVYGDNPEVVEIMVQLPNLVKSMMESTKNLTIVVKENTTQMALMQNQILSLLDIQTKTIQAISKQEISSPAFSNEGGMYV